MQHTLAPTLASSSKRAWQQTAGSEPQDTLQREGSLGSLAWKPGLRAMNR